jgi:hypothetical protein
MINPSAIASDIKAGARKAVDYVKKKVDFGNPDKERGMINPGAMADDMKGGKTSTKEAIRKAKAEGKTFEEWVKGEGTSIYHGTDKVFDNFDVSKTADGGIWFTNRRDLIEKGQVGASGKGRVMDAFIKENDLKLANWDEVDKYTDGQLRRDGYDGYKLVEDDEITYKIFDPSKIKTTSQLRAEWDAVSTSDKIRAIPEPAPKVPKQITPQEKDEILSMLDYIRTADKYDKKMTEMIDRYARRFGFNPSAKKLDEQLEDVMLNAKIAPLPGGTRGR